MSDLILDGLLKEALKEAGPRRKVRVKITIDPEKIAKDYALRLEEKWKFRKLLGDDFDGERFRFLVSKGMLSVRLSGLDIGGVRNWVDLQLEKSRGPTT